MDHRLKSKMQNYKTSRKKKTGKNLHDLGFDDSILDVIPKAQSIEKNINRLDFAKIRNGLCERHY